MRIKSGAVGVGLGLAFITGGAVAYGEANHMENHLDVVKGCQLDKYAGTAICDKLVIGPSAVTDQANEAGFLYFAAALGVVGGIIGTAVGYSDLRNMESEELKIAKPKKAVAPAAE